LPNFILNYIKLYYCSNRNPPPGPYFMGYPGVQ
jgi:hypothetical protein